MILYLFLKASSIFVLTIIFSPYWILLLTCKSLIYKYSFKYLCLFNCDKLKDKPIFAMHIIAAATNLWTKK